MICKSRLITQKIDHDTISTSPLIYISSKTMSEYPVLLSIIDSEGFWVVKSSIDMCWSWRRGARAGISVLEAKLSEHSARTNNFEEFLSYLAAKKLFDESEAEKFYVQDRWRNWSLTLFLQESPARRNF